MSMMALEKAGKNTNTQISLNLGQLYFELGIKQAKNKDSRPTQFNIKKKDHQKRDTHQLRESTNPKQVMPYYNGSLELLQLYMQEAGQYEVLSRYEEQQLFRRLEEGELEVREDIINHNLRLVISNAQKYANQGIDLLDLIQEGNIGLMTAVDKFDYRRGYKFSTYATYWIRQTILRFISSRGRTIKVSENVKDIVKKYKQFVDEFMVTHGYAPSIEMAAEELEMEPESLNETITSFESTDLYSLDFLMNYDEGKYISLVDCIPDRTPLPEETSLYNDMKEKISMVLMELSEREESIIRLRFGLDDGKPRTLEDIGKIFGVTREWICQIERSAIEKLKTGIYADDLKEMLLGLND